MKSNFFALLNVSCALSACAALPAPPSDFRPSQVQAVGPVRGHPEELGDGIPTGSLEAARLDQARIAAGLTEVTKGTYGNVHSVLIFRNGRLVSESYFPGQDENNHQGRMGLVQHSRETLHDVRSVTKSVVALAVLIARAQGHISSLDRPIFDYFPEYAANHSSGEKAEITIRQALTMSAGLDWSEGRPDADNALLSAAPDPVAFVLSRPLASPPGVKFTYNGGLTELLAAVVHRSSGSDIEKFVRNHLLTPLGIKKYEWAKRPNGKLDPDSGLRLRSRDLAKIGLLLSNKGEWGGKQILPARSAEEAVEAHIDIPRTGEAAARGDRLGYGYQIWLPSYLADGKRVQLIQLDGNGGQLVTIDRQAQLMVVTTGGDYYRRDLKKSAEDIYYDIVEPALLDR